MATKKENLFYESKTEVQEEAFPQTEMESATEVPEGSENLSPEEMFPQTGIELERGESESNEHSGAERGFLQTETESILKAPEKDKGSEEQEALPQTGTESAPEIPGEDMPRETGNRFSQTEKKPNPEIPDDNADPTAESPIPQTEIKQPRKPGRPKKTSAISSQSGTEGKTEKKAVLQAADLASKTKTERAPTRLGPSVLSIDEHRTVQTEADKAKNDLLDLLESQKTGRILTGTIQGVERPSDNLARYLAVIYHGEFKIIIPAEEAVEPPEDYRGRLPEDVLHYMLTKRLGAEVDYIIKGIDAQSGIAVGSRLEAMRARRKQYYLGTDRDGNNLLHSGVCAEARIVSVIRAGIFVDLFGLEIYIPLRELSYQRWMDAAGHFQPGQRILVKVLEVDRSDRNQIRAKASVKQAGENPYERALRRYSEGNRYVGTVSMVDTNGVFVALDGGIDCLCSYPKRGRPPRGSRVTVRILGINHESNRIWGAITHIAAPR